MRRLAEALAFLGLATGLHAAALVGFGDTSGQSGGGEGGQSSVTLTAAPPALSDLVRRWDAPPEISDAPTQNVALNAEASPNPQPHADRAIARSALAAPVAPETEAAPTAPAPSALPPRRQAEIAHLMAPAADARVPDLAARVAALPVVRRAALPVLQAPTIGVAPAPVRPAALPPLTAPRAPEVPRPATTFKTPTTPKTPDGPPPRSARSQPDRTAPAAPLAAEAPALPRADTSSALPASSEFAVDRSKRPQARPPVPKVAARAAGQGKRKVRGAASAATSPALSEGQTRTLVARWGGQIVARVERAKRYPRGSRASGTTRLRLVVARSGALQGVSVAGSSGDVALDRAALAAVKRAGRFPAAPDGLGKASYRFTVRIRMRP